uniref:Uncharacterized protein n=1 Tax=Alexandrium monilatum TaxID=311494 RepID=A0A7S4UUN1_9DINO
MPARRRRDLLWECPQEVRLVGLVGPCAMLGGVYVNTQRFVGGRPSYAKVVYFSNGFSSTALLAAQGEAGEWALRPAHGYRQQPWPVLGAGGGGSASRAKVPECPPGREEAWYLGRRGHSLRVHVPEGASGLACDPDASGGEEGQGDTYAPVPVWAQGDSYMGGFRPDCWLGKHEHYYFCCQYPPGNPAFNPACFDATGEYEFCCFYHHGPGTRILPARWQRVVHLDIGGQRIWLEQNSTHQQAESVTGCMLWLDGIARLLVLGHFRWAQRPQFFLDIGAGLGLAAIAAGRMGHMALGLEPGQCALEHARRNVAADPVAREKVQIVPFDVCEGAAALRRRYLRPPWPNWFDVVLIAGLGCLGPAVVRCIAQLAAAVGGPEVLVVVDEPVPEFRPDFAREFAAVGLRSTAEFNLGLLGWANPVTETLLSIWSRQPPADPKTTDSPPVDAGAAAA